MGRRWNVVSVCLVLVLLVSPAIADDDAEDPGAQAEEVNPEPLQYMPRYPHPHHDENGVVDWMPRIIGGTHADVGEFPAKVSVQSRSGSHFCGGTLLDQFHVLTAAHCVTNDRGIVFDPNALRLMGDDVSITPLASRSRQLRFASHIFVHPQYSAWTLANDIAVVRVSVQFSRTSTFHPLNMNHLSPVPDKMCVLAGWGLTAEHNNRPSPELLRVDLQVITTEICNDTLSYNGMIQAGQFCAGTMLGGRDACQGDSGGGLICDGLITGVVSFGFGCGRPRFPGVYIDVSQYIEWILMSINWQGLHDEIPRPTTTSSPPNASTKTAVSVLTMFAVNLHLITKFLEIL